MKKTILKLIVFITLPLLSAAGQEDRAPAVGSSISHSMLRQGTPSNNSMNALFDLQFNYTLGRSGFAGVTWTYTDFWISKWQSDSLFTVNKVSGAISPAFFISGLTAVRGMTFDGHYIYAVDNSTSIFKIDTLTKTIVGTYTAPFAIRGIAYDSSANGGLGGFWVNNFNTDIALIDTLGNTLASIFAGVHGLTAMYSIAFDPYTSGGPYIWAFDQGAAGTGKFLVRIPIATGIPDLTHNVTLDIPLGSAGGLTISGFANPGPHSLVGVTQGTPSRLFSYELSDYIPPAYDASADTLHFNPAFTKTPSFLIAPINWEVATTNNGGNALDTLGIDFTVNDGSTNVFTANGFANAVAPLAHALVAVPGTFTPVSQPGTNYSVTALINTGSQNDSILTNDTISYNFSITDTVMASNGPAAGRIGLTAGSDGIIGQLFNIPTTCYATSATFTLVRPTLGDVVYAELFDWNGSTPNAEIARSADYTITAADTGGVILTLPYLSAPVQMTPASYLAGIHQTNNNVSLAYSLFNWRPNTCWVNFTSSGTWAASETLTPTFFIVPFVSLNIWSQVMISVSELDNSVLSLYPNPASGELNVVNPYSDKCKLTISDMQGKVVFTNTFEGKQKEVVRTSEWSNGIYMAKVESGTNSSVSKIVISH